MLPLGAVLLPSGVMPLLGRMAAATWRSCWRCSSSTTASDGICEKHDSACITHVCVA